MLHLDAVLVVAVPAIALLLTRAGAILIGSHIATRVVGAGPTLRKYAGFGLLPQAGFALALALSLSRSFPEFGAEATALVLAIVSVNELIAPALYRWSLVWSGEVGVSTETSGEIDQELV